MKRTHMHLATLTLLLTAAVAPAQVISTTQSIELKASKGPYLTIAPPNLTTQEVAVVDSAATEFPTAFTTTVSWDVPNATTTVKLVAYFATPAQALTNTTAGTYIPSSMIEVSTDNGTTWVPLTGNAVGTAGMDGGSATLYVSAATSGTNKKSSAPISFKVRVNLTNQYREAGMYVGTLTLIAICN